VKWFPFLFFIPAVFFAQRGVVLENTSTSLVDGQTYALIMGVSQYKNPEIPTLKYAHRDALVLEKYLSESGVNADHIYTFVNEQATASAFWSTLNFISEKIAEGDRLLIYFSGHGDVESKTIVKDAYLLPYDSPSSVYPMGAIGVTYLKSWLATFSSKGIQTIFVADACRSGNLIGGREGVSATASLLKEEWVDEIKLVSCQPGELSLEGEQWGGGRGLFSFELINGLCGAADKNNDGLISVREIHLYLLESVPEKSGRMPQNPMVSGNAESIIAKVNPKFLTENQSTDKQWAPKEVVQPVIAARAIVNREEQALESSIPKEVETYNVFLEYLGKNNIVNRAGYESAYKYYQLLPEEGAYIELKQTARQLLIERILNRMNWFIQEELANPSHNNEINVLVLSLEASLLRKILGDEALKSSGNFSKVLFMEAFRSLRSFGHEGSAAMPIELALMKLDSALIVEPNAVYVYTMKGVIFQFEMKKYAEAEMEFKKAVEGNPDFLIARGFLLGNLYDAGKYREIPAYASINPSKLELNLYAYLAYDALKMKDSTTVFLMKATNDCYGIWESEKRFLAYANACFFLMDNRSYSHVELFFKGAFKAFDEMIENQDFLKFWEEKRNLDYNYADFLFKQNRTSEGFSLLKKRLESGDDQFSDFRKLVDRKELKGKKEFLKLVDQYEEKYKKLNQPVDQEIKD